MRRIAWCFVVGGLLINGLSIGFSDDSAPRTEPAAATPPAQSAPQAYRRSGSPPAEERPNFAELFRRSEKRTADNPFATEAETGPAAEETAPPMPAAAKEAAAPRRAGNVSFSRGPRKVLATESLSAYPTAETDDDVIHAEYENGPDAPSSPAIQQVAERSAADADFQTSPLFEGPVAGAPVSSDLPRPATQTTYAEPSAKAIAPQSAVTVASGSQTPAIEVEWVKKSESHVGQEFTCELVVKNTGSAPATNIELSAFFSDNVRLLRADPKPVNTEDFLSWTLAGLKAGESETIAVTMLPLSAEEITTQAEVRFSTAVAGRFDVSQPMLAVELSGPEEVLIGEAASQTILVTNPGTGVASDVQIEAIIPGGLEHARGTRLLMDLGALHPGESRTVRLPLAAVAGGDHLIHVKASGAADLLDETIAKVSVIAPQVAASIDGPSLRYLGRRATYTLSVVNDGHAQTENVRMMHKVPDGFELVSIGQGAQFDAKNRMINWYVGHLDSGDAARLDVTFECRKIGAHTHFIRATSEYGSVSDAQISTAVEGTPSLAMDIQDLEDPVELGTEAAYEIKLKNEGSAPASMVSLACELPEGMKLIDAAAPVEFINERNVLVFEPIRSLGPGQTVTVRIQVSSQVSGNLRFRARLSSESIEEPLIEEELTKFYGE